MAIDKERLLVWLAERAEHRNPVLAAVYTGMADRLRRGDFDEDAR